MRKGRRVNRGTERKGHTFRNMHSMPRKPGSLPYQPPFLRQQLRHLPTHELVSHRLPTDRVDDVRISHLPRPTRAAVVITHALLRCHELGLARIKCISIFVFLAANFSRSWSGIDLEYCVVRPINVGIHAQAEEMLVIVCVDAGGYLSAPAVRVLAGVHGVCVQYAGEFDLKLDRAVQVEDPVDAILVVCGCEDVRDDQFAAAGRYNGVVAEIGVLEQDSCVFFVDADGVPDGLRGA